MWYIPIIIISALAIVFGAYSCNLKNSRNSIINSGVLPDDSVKKISTRSAIKEQLEALSIKPAPTELSPGAMCYSVAIEPDSTNYTCPKCGEKTLYTKSAGRFVRQELPGCRSLANTFPEINLTLDETQYCKKCSPEIDSPQLCITYQFSDDTTKTHLCSISKVDLQIMKEFIRGGDKHLAGQGREVPLKDYLPRLQELFGIKIEK